jgi:putative transposase
MAFTEHYYTKFKEGNFYHVYNRSVDRKPMFMNDGNYEFFLIKYDQYLSSVIDTYAYCLLGNHFHLLMRVRDLTLFRKQDLATLQKLSNLSAHDIISHQFRKFFQSYAMAFNKQQGRIGTLFQTPFKRALVNNDQYFTQLVYYIHSNPQSHGLVSDFKEWKWSSYGRMLIEKPSKLRKQEVIDWFGDANSYRQLHSLYTKTELNKTVFLEDD